MLAATVSNTRYNVRRNRVPAVLPLEMAGVHSDWLITPIRFGEGRRRKAKQGEAMTVLSILHDDRLRRSRE
jgi:hypothetical protein